MKEIYNSMVECKDRTHTELVFLEISCDRGKLPTIGDFIEAFRKSGIEVTLYDLQGMIFRPVDPLHARYLDLKVNRTFKVR